MIKQIKRVTKMDGDPNSRSPDKFGGARQLAVVRLISALGLVPNESSCGSVSFQVSELWFSVSPTPSGWWALVAMRPVLSNTLVFATS